MTTNEEKIIYTDGKGVKITDRNFYTEEHTYLLEGITDVKLVRKPASKWPGILLFILGVIGLVIGSFEWLDNWRIDAGDSIYIIDAGAVLIGAGVVFILLGIILMVALKDHFAVAIRTAEGHRQPVVSSSREYAAHVVGLLKTAYHRYISPSEKRIHPTVH